MIASSPDGQWAARKRGREVALFAGAGGPAAVRIELPSDDADLVIVGPPSVVAVVTRTPPAGAAGGDEPGAPCDRLVLYQPPYLDAVARLDLELPMRIAGVTGSRLVLVSRDARAAMFVRVAGRALAAQPIDPGSPIEFAVGLDRNQVLFGLLRKLESWDAVSGRPLLRVQLPLPPAPRTIGPAHGHVWATRPGGDEILVVRLSDSRPFRHALGGVVIDDVIWHPASPLLVLVTARGLVRLHCFAHSLTVIDAPWHPGTELAQLVVGDDISLLGIADGGDEPWRVPIGGAGAAPIALETLDAPGEPMVTAADKLRAMRERTAHEPAVAAERSERGDRAEPTADHSHRPPPAAGSDRPPPAEHGYRPPPAAGSDRPPPLEAGYRPPPAEHGYRSPPAAGSDRPPTAEHGYRSPPAAGSDRPPPAAAAVAASAAAAPAPTPRPFAPPRTGNWRDALAAYGASLAWGGDADLPPVAADTELGAVALRLALPAPARRALVALYSAYLVGEPAVPLAVLARALGDWTEALGRGELAALAMLRRRAGAVALRGSVTDLLDGAAPRAIRVIGDAQTSPRAGATRLARDGRSDAAIESELVAQLGRIAVVEGGAALALLEARLYGATAVALAPPPIRPQPWPRDAGLIVVAEPAAPAWVAALPALTAA